MRRPAATSRGMARMGRILVPPTTADNRKSLAFRGAFPGRCRARRGWGRASAAQEAAEVERVAHPVVLEVVVEVHVGALRRGGQWSHFLGQFIEFGGRLEVTEPLAARGQAFAFPGVRVASVQAHHDQGGRRHFAHPGNARGEALRLVDDHVAPFGSASGAVWCRVNSRKAFTTKEKPSGVRSAQSWALRAEGSP